MSLHGFTDDEYEADDNQPTLISKLDLSSPLHLHPNDSATLTVVFVKLKGTKDYQVWSCAMLLALEGKNKTGFIDGSCRRSNTHEVLGRQWDRVNDVVLGLILNSISEELFLGQFFSKRAKHVWDELKETYDKVDGYVTFNLHHKINSLSQNGSSIADYYHRLNAMWKQFDALVQLPRCTCHAADDFKKHNQLMKLMSVYVIISREESHRVVSSSGVGASQRSQSSIFISNVGNRADFGKRNDNNNSSNQGVQNFNRRFVNNNNSVGSSSNSFSDDQISKLITLIKENSLNSTGKGVQANMAGTNQHLTYIDKDLINVIDISYLGITVSHPNGTEACITKVGNMVLNKTLTLYDVLVVPEYYVSLMSVHKLARDNNLIVAFDESKCFVLPQDLRDLKVLRTGSQIDGLYYFDKGIHVVCSLTKGVWHSRLGHPSEHVLKVYMLKSKDEVFECILVFYNLLKNQFGKSVKIFRSDNGTKFTNKTCETFCANNGIIHQTSCVYTPQQNGTVERKHMHLLNIARSLMFQEGLSLRLWCECFLTACYLINRLPSSVLNGDSPYKLFSSRSEKCVLVGYSSVKKGYKLYSLERKQFIFSRDVKFVENVFPFKTITTSDHSQDLDHSNFFNNLDVEIPDTPYDKERVANKSDSDGSNSSHDGSPTFDHQEDAEMPSYGSNGSATKNEMAATPEDTNNSSEGVIGDVQHTEAENNDAQPVRRSERSSVFPKRYNDFVVDSKVKAMNKEMDALYKNDTWDITDLPIGRKSIGGKWVYKIKYKSSGEIERYKARYVVKGYNQKEGIDFDETFSHVVKITVYMDFPEGYFSPDDKRVCRLKKSLYGLKQALI
ncbi:ribonuclease H-like domain-containing protein [Tanacetum coccineum]